MKRTDTFDQMLASIRAGIYVQQQRVRAEARDAAPFVTVSRQADAGGRTLARALADRLNRDDPSGRPWTVWDHDLVEKVAREEHIPVSLVESLEAEGPHRSMFQDFLASLSAKNDAADLDEFQVYRRVARATRTLARAGRAVIVGCGGVYATFDLPGGVHVRLVAPLEHRIGRMAQAWQTSQEEAAREVHRLDRYRETFHRRYWHDKALLPEIFTLTINSARVDEDRMVECVVPLIPKSAPVAARGAPDAAPQASDAAPQAAGAAPQAAGAAPQAAGAAPAAAGVTT